MPLPEAPEDEPVDEAAVEAAGEATEPALDELLDAATVGVAAAAVDDEVVGVLTTAAAATVGLWAALKGEPPWVQETTLPSMVAVTITSSRFSAWSFSWTARCRWAWPDG